MMPTEIKQSAETAVVVGGGLIGLCTALNLQARGIKTLVIDPVSVRRAASWGNAGHIAVEQVEPLASAATVRSFSRRLYWRGGALSLPLRDIAAWLPFSLRLLAASRPKRFEAGKAALKDALSGAMPSWRRLTGMIGAPQLLIEDGHFIVWETIESAAAGRASWARVDTGGATFRDATAAELALLTAQMKRPPAGAIRFLGTGRIADPGDLAEILDAEFARLGGDQRCASVESIILSGEKASIRLDGGETLTSDAIVIAAGVESGQLLAPLGIKVPIVAERGYHIQSAHSEWPESLPPVVFEDRSMIVTRFRSGLRAASFVEFAKSASPPDRRKWARLRAHVRALGLPFHMPGKRWMGARPTLPDYLPAIGRVSRAANLFYAFGHQHLGLTLAPLTGEVIAALVAGEAPAIDLAPFDVQRFQGNRG